MKFVHLSNPRLFSGNIENPFSIDFEEERLEAFQKVIALCQSQSVEALFITGNLFDAAPTLDLVEQIDEMLLAAPKTRTFILTGERDQVGASDTFASYEWKSNTTVFFGDCIQRVFVAKYDLEVTGLGYSETTWSKVRLEKLTHGRKGAFQILLLPKLEGDEETLRGLKLPFDYVAVGADRIMIGDVNEKCYAPGDFAAETFSTQMEHGFYFGEIKEGRPRRATISFVPSENREFVSLRIQATEDTTIDEIRNEVKETIEKYGDRNLYRVSIAGDSNPALYFEKESLYALGHITEVRDETTRSAVLEKLMKEHEGDALGRFITDMLPDDNQEIRRKALNYGVEALLKMQEKEA